MNDNGISGGRKRRKGGRSQHSLKWSGCPNVAVGLAIPLAGLRALPCLLPTLGALGGSCSHDEEAWRPQGCNSADVGPVGVRVTAACGLGPSHARTRPEASGQCGTAVRVLPASICPASIDIITPAGQQLAAGGRGNGVQEFGLAPAPSFPCLPSLHPSLPKAPRCRRLLRGAEGWPAPGAFLQTKKVSSARGDARWGWRRDRSGFPLGSRWTKR